MIIFAALTFTTQTCETAFEGALLFIFRCMVVLTIMSTVHHQLAYTRMLQYNMTSERYAVSDILIKIFDKHYCINFKIP